MENEKIGKELNNKTELMKFLSGSWNGTDIKIIRTKLGTYVIISLKFEGR